MSGKYLLVQIAMMCLAFDHKSEAGGSIFLYGCMAVFLLANFLIFSKLGIPKYRNKLDFVAAFCLASPSFFSILPLLFGDLHTKDFVINSIPYFFMIMGYNIGLLFSRNTNDFSSLESCALRAGVISIAFYIYHGLSTSNVGIDQIRYQIISPFCGLVFVSIITDSMIHRTLRPASILGLSLLTFVLFVSVTRSFLLTIVFTAIASLYFVGQDRKFKILSTKRIIVFITFMCASNALLPEVWSRWLYRFYGANQDVGFDVTSITRVAEILGQWSALVSDAFVMIWGKGVGGAYQWDQSFTILLQTVDPVLDYTNFYNFPGHNFWVYSLFANGFVFGPILPLFLICLTIMCMRTLNRSSMTDSPQIHSGLFFCTAFLASVLFSTTGGNPLGSRATGYLMGVFVGSGVGLLIRLKKAASTKTHNTSQQL